MPNEMKRVFEVPGKDIQWRNMQGSATDVAPAGRREFAIRIDDELAHELEAEGWTCVKWKPLDKNDPNSPMIPRFKVRMNFQSFNPPKVYIVGSNGKTRTLVDESYLDDQNIDRRELDWCDVSVNSYHSTVNGRNYCTAYLSELYIKFADGAFDYKYVDAENVPF